MGQPAGGFQGNQCIGFAVEDQRGLGDAVKLGPQVNTAIGFEERDGCRLRGAPQNLQTPVFDVLGVALWNTGIGKTLEGSLVIMPQALLNRRFNP